MIILNYAPDVSSGSEKMLALLFDMNRLWEEYVLVLLKQACQVKSVEVTGQGSIEFWSKTKIKPDVILRNANEDTFIIDTKWKNIDDAVPSTNDLRQMYVYNDYWKSKKALLLYPSNETNFDKFVGFKQLTEKDHHKCGIGRISIFTMGSDVLDEGIGKAIYEWFN